MKLSALTIPLLFASFLFAQVPDTIQRYRDDSKGDFKSRRQGIMEGNRVRTIYFNNGEIGQWPYSPSLEWPAGSNHQYLDGLTFMVGARVVAPGNNLVIHPLEISYREEMPRDPVTGLIWGFEPLPGYSNPLSPKIAMSNDVNSYPNIWPPSLGVGDDWNGSWFGYFGKGAKEHVLETFFVMDDSKDGKYKRAPYLYYPIAADSGRGGLGLRVEERGLQFQQQFLQDILFWNYNIINISDHNYDSTVIGLFLDPGIGGTGSGFDDASVDLHNDLFYSWDHSGKGDPLYGNWKPGYVGISVLESPNKLNEKNISSISITPLSDKGPNGVWPKNNETMWRKMTGGFTDTGIANSNISVVIGSNIFGLPKWSSAKYSTALILGNDLSEMIMKKHIAKTIQSNNFIVPEDIASLGTVQLAMQTPMTNVPLSGSINITWSVQGAVGTTNSYVYISSNGGNDWSLAGTDNNGNNSCLWNTTLFPDGILYKIRIMTIADNGNGYRESDKFITVNNAVSAKPEILLTSLRSKSLLHENYSIDWVGGDADGDSSVVNISYKLSYESQWTTIVSNISGSAGTYLWNTKSVPNSSLYDYEIKVEIISNTDTATVFVKGISIVNSGDYKASEPFITSKKSNGTGSIVFNIVDAPSVVNHSYLLTFSLKNSVVKGAVTDLNTGGQKVSDIYPIDNNHETKTFDGIRLRIANDKLEPDYGQIGWVNGTSTFPIIATYDSSSPPLNTRLPYDYQINFSNVVVDTSIDLDPVTYPVIPLRFSIKNLTTNKKVFSLLQDNDGDKLLTKGDVIKIIDFINGNISMIWKVSYGTQQANIPEPTLGDVYLIKTKKPFAAGDSIIFTTQGLTSVKRMNEIVPSRYTFSQNYPNPFNPVTTIHFSIPIADNVELKIYDVLGKEIVTLVQEKLPAGEYSVLFNGTNLSTGMYVARFQSGNFLRSQKMILIK